MKKVLIIGGVSVVVLAAILFTLISLNSARPKAGVDSSGNWGMAEAPSAAGLSSRGTSFASPIPSDSFTAEVASSDEVALAATDKKVIKSGNLNLQVEKTDTAAAKIGEIAKANGGEIFSSNFSQTKTNIKSGTVTVKVPVANFEKAFGELKKVATLVINESTSGQDVTDQYVDLQGQLKNAQAEEQQFVEIMKQAQKIQDILDVTAQLSRVRGTIERLQGRIKLMDSQTDMSTISISLTEDTNITVVDSWRPLQVIKEAFNSLIKSLQGLIDFLIHLIIEVIPVLSIIALIIWAIYKLIRKIYLKIHPVK